MGAAIWQNDSGRWRLSSPEPYADEATLHSRVEEAPEILPLAGTPDLVVVGREVALGNGIADLIAIEPSGRLVVIEVKLARNPEARRAVIAQILTYAAFLRGLSVESLERDILASHLSRRGHSNLTDLVASSDQTGSFERAAFEQALSQNLNEGRFRLVLVLDAVPDELVRLVGYLSLIAERVLIDLITVSAYQIAGTQILVPQRVDPENQPTANSAMSPNPAPSKGRLVEGAKDFEDAIERTKPEHQPTLRRLLEWAVSLGELNGVRLQTYHAKNGYLTLLPRLRADNAGLVSIYLDGSEAGLWLWRSVFERRAPASLPSVEKALGDTVRQGNAAKTVTAELLDALTSAYREAVAGRVAPVSEQDVGGVSG